MKQCKRLKISHNTVVALTREGSESTRVSRHSFQRQEPVEMEGPLFHWEKSSMTCSDLLFHSSVSVPLTLLHICSPRMIPTLVRRLQWERDQSHTNLLLFIIHKRVVRVLFKPIPLPATIGTDLTPSSSVFNVTGICVTCLLLLLLLSYNTSWVHPLFVLWQRSCFYLISLFIFHFFLTLI